MRRYHNLPSWELMALLVILLLATFLRLWRLDALPVGLHHDEAYNGLDALALLDGQQFPIFHEGWELYQQKVHGHGPVYQTRAPVFFEGNYGREPLAIYLMAGSITLFGNTPFSIRLVPAVSGVLGVLLTYYVTKALALTVESRQTRNQSSKINIPDSLLPLLAALTMAILYPAVSLSRYGVRAMVFVPIEAFCVYCFWKGVRNAEQRELVNLSSGTLSARVSPLGTFAPKWFVLAGLFLGAGIYTYAAGRFMPLLFLSVTLIWAIRDRRFLRRMWTNLATMAFTSVVVLTPLLLFFIRHPYYALTRSLVIANRGGGTYPGRPWLTWMLNVGRVFGGIFWHGDSDLRRNIPGRAFLDPIQSTFAALGLFGFLKWRLNKSRVFLILWLIFMLIPGIVSGDAPHFGRLIGAVVPISILVGLGAVWFIDTMLRRWHSFNDRFPQLLVLGIMVLMLLSGILTTSDYFGRYASHPELSKVFLLPDWRVGQYVSNLPEKSTVYLTPTQEQMATIYFAVAGQRERLRSFFSPNNTLVPMGKDGEANHYLIRPTASDISRPLAERFPSGIFDRSQPDFVTFISQSDRGDVDFALETDISWGGAINLRDWRVELINQDVHVTIVWQANVEMVRSYTAFVHLLSTDGTLITQIDRLPDGYPTSDWHVGERVSDTYRLTLPADFVKGEYILQTGFYFLPTDERLGEPVQLGILQIP